MTEEQRIDDILRANIPIIEDIQNRKDESLSNWIKNIITLLVGLLSVLVAFKSDNPETKLIHQLFSLTLILLGLSVLSGVVFLYSSIDRLSRKEIFHVESLSKRIRGNREVLNVSIKDKRIFVFFSWLFYISSVASVISLICYGIMKN
jgi:hypothetical protein